MDSRRSMASAFAGLPFITGGVPLAGAQSSQLSSSLGSKASESHPGTQLLLGSDGKTRATTTVSEPGVQGKKVELLPDDRLEVTEGGQEAHIVNADEDVVGIVEAPRLVAEDGTQKEAHFVVYGDLLTLQAQQDGIQFRSCTRSEVGKWTYRVGAAGVWAEDNITFNGVC